MTILISGDADFRREAFLLGPMATPGCDMVQLYSLTNLDGAKSLAVLARAIPHPSACKGTMQNSLTRIGP